MAEMFEKDVSGFIEERPEGLERGRYVLLAQARTAPWGYDAKARKKEIESGRFEPVGRRVGAYEFDQGARRQPLGSPRQHRR